MSQTHSFRFKDDRRNSLFISLLKKHRVQHTVDRHGTVRYAPADEELVENELLQVVRDQVFPSWQIVSCPEDWTERYRVYMTKHAVPFAEELIDNRLHFLIPRNYHPHAWNI